MRTRCVAVAALSVVVLSACGSTSDSQPTSSSSTSSASSSSRVSVSSSAPEPVPVPTVAPEDLDRSSEPPASSDDSTTASPSNDGQTLPAPEPDQGDPPVLGAVQDSGVLRISVNSAHDRPASTPFGHAAIEVTVENTGIAVTEIGQMNFWYATDAEGRKYLPGPAGGEDVNPAFPIAKTPLQPGEKVTGWIVFDANEVPVADLRAVFDGAAGKLTWSLFE